MNKIPHKILADIQATDSLEVAKALASLLAFVLMEEAAGDQSKIDLFIVDITPTTPSGGLGKIPVIKVLREIFNLGLLPAKKMTDYLPYRLELRPTDNPEMIKRALEAAGATIETRKRVG